MSKGFISETTDTTFGTHSHDEAQQTVSNTGKYHKSTISYQHRALPEGMVDVGGQIVSREVAEMMQLPIHETKPAIEKEKPPTSQTAEREVEGKSANERLEQQAHIEAWDGLLDAVDDNFTSDQKEAFIEAALDMDDDALEFMGEAPVLALVDQAETIASRYGMQSLTAMQLLPEDMQREARAALIGANREQEFGRYVQQALSNLDHVVRDHEFHSEIAEQTGGFVRGGNLYDEDGTNLGPLKNCILNGTLRWDF